MIRARQIPLRVALAIPLVAVSLVACQQADVPTAGTGARLSPGDPAFHLGCVAGGKYTGGGRVDPSGVGKVTFGFNIHAGDCSGSDIKGSLQVVYHESQTLVHSVMEGGHFASFEDPVKGSCGEWNGTARVKHVYAGGDWHMHDYFIEVCDKAEPGRGADTFSFYLEGPADGLHNNVIDERLTGGNIQAHKN